MRSSDLPVSSALPGLRAALDGGGTAVLAAPPGTGKTTLVPLALAQDGHRVIVAEPRRMAARAAAYRMAWMLGEPVGRRVGYAIRGERRPGSAVEVVTTGLLLQRLQHDPDLRADVVILDECHERHLDADTALAFLLDVRQALRPDLRLVAASATADTGPWSRLLGGAPVVTAAAATHPLEVVWAPPPRPVRPPHGMSVDPALLDHVALTVRRGLTEGDGDVLCFLPGAAELARVAGALGDLNVLRLHGRAPGSVQDAVLRPRDAGEGRRVVLATAVAESSLTVPGVRTVVDAGLSREPRTDHARGLGALTTVRVSRAAADQRAGRAGREAPGRVYRCWSQADHDHLPERPRPEIELADLTAFALQTACWGDPDAGDLTLLDPPPPAAMRAARDTLRAIGAVDGGGRVTERGRAMARVGVHPRLARALIDGAEHVGERAAEVVALLSDQRASGDDLLAEWRARRSDAPWREEVRRLRRSAPADAGSETRPASGPSARSGSRAASEPHGGSAPHAGSGSAGGSGPRGGARVDDETVAGIVVALAFPERVARVRDGGYLMASGTAAELARGSSLAGAEWLAIAVADRRPGAPSARIRQAVPIDEETARLVLEATAEDEVQWRGDVVARRVERLGAIEVAVAPLTDPAPGLVRAALREGLRREGLGLLTWTRDAEALRARLAFCHRVLGPPWPAMDDDALLGSLDLASGGARGRADLARVDVTAALRGLLPWECAARLDEVAPERLTVPSGSRIRVDYSGDRPVLAAKLQELFGWQAAPSVAGVPLVVHLLSPAGRPAAVTADLTSFWREGYRSVRAELRGRYPRHPWPEDPATAEPTRRTNARRR